MTKHTPMSLSSRIGWALLFALPWAGAILAALPAAALLLRGLWGLLFQDWRLTLSHGIVYVLVPALYLLLVWRAFREPHSIASGILRVPLLWLLGIVVLIFSWLFATALSPFETHSVIREDAVSAFVESQSQSVLTEFQNPEPRSPSSTVFHNCTRSAPFYHVSVRVLLCGYTPEDYEREKAELKARYSFRTEPLQAKSYSDDAVHSYPPEIALGDDVFHYLDVTWEGCTPPFYEHSYLLVTNDSRHEIAWVVFGQDSAHGIDTDLRDFLKEDCCWHMIR